METTSRGAGSFVRLLQLRRLVFSTTYTLLNQTIMQSAETKLISHNSYSLSLGINYEF